MSDAILSVGQANDTADPLNLKLRVSLDTFVGAVVEIFPIFIVPFFIFIVLLVLVKVGAIEFTGELGRIAIFEVVFFSLIGVGVAYLSYLSREQLLSYLLPQLIVAFVFISQLIGLSRGGDYVPLASRRVFLAGIGATISFIVASMYLSQFE